LGGIEERKQDKTLLSPSLWLIIKIYNWSLSMFELEKTFSFDAGHQLVHHDGKCQNPHGHTYVLKIQLKSDQLIQSGPKKNMVTDFSYISSIVNPMIEKYFDHQWLNDTLETDSPSAEFIAFWIFNYLAPHLTNLSSVTVFENPTSSACYKS
jgi:6-pyruvoyltetrahydropterin/6-carboxytetrahydropterin synthase